ncbi:DNA-binding protein [Azospirillum sp. YIM B02556]|uniref:DNA-binding protein n=1 Tax=Azospirillum endophyticum TaxID=2800326 RepID=A0ABS1F8B3_9PROT|nr:DNA-binding protein [Azospirillum endophyticum]MBK1839650.1 DNA-binding protein [Azospirillum endophyticum]
MWEFVLKFRLPLGQEEPTAWLDALFEAGCDDATVGTGRRGSIALDFSREAVSAETAVRSAIADVLKAIPGALLIEIAPDLVNLADLAEIVGCSRQNIRKYAAGEIRAVAAAFPDPVYTGNPSLWRLVEALIWLERNTDIHPDPRSVELARVASEVGADIQHRRLTGLIAAE